MVPGLKVHATSVGAVLQCVGWRRIWWILLGLEIFSVWPVIYTKHLLAVFFIGFSIDWKRKGYKPGRLNLAFDTETEEMATARDTFVKDSDDEILEYYTRLWCRALACSQLNHSTMAICLGTNNRPSSSMHVYVKEKKAIGMYQTLLRTEPTWFPWTFVSIDFFWHCSLVSVG